jgi:hypothetical protein
VITALVIVLLLSASAAVAVHFAGWLGERRSTRSGLPPLVIPLDFTSARTSERAAAPEWPMAEQIVERPTPRGLAALDDDAPADTVHFVRPGEEALQLLPAHLEGLAGVSRRQDIRFVRTPGEPPHMILGREPGASPHHVALASSTVSRQHARVAYTDGAWRVTNLSRTNPVVVNDDTLAGSQVERTLCDGDRIELGDVVLRFRAR